MKTRQLTRNLTWVCLAGLLVAGSSVARADVYTKADNSDNLNQPTSWVGGIVPGAADIAQWDATVTSAQTVALGDHTSWLGINILAPNGGNNGTALTISNTGGYTLTLGAAGITTAINQNYIFNNALALSADQTWNIASGITIPSGGVDLAGHTLILAGTGTKQFKSDVTGNGNIVIRDGTVSMAGGAVATSTDITVNKGGTLYFDVHRGDNARAASVTLNDSNLTATADTGTVGTPYQTDRITGALTVTNGQSIITLNPRSNSNERLAAGSLLHTGAGAALIRGIGLGQNTIASQTANATNIALDVAPTMVGGSGIAGTTNISILPWAIGDLSSSGVGSSFVTYDAANGIRLLDITTEYDTYADAYSGAVSGTDHNVQIPGAATVEFTGENTINSLLLSGADATVNGGTLHVTSGAIFAAIGNNKAYINTDLDFGSVRGYIGSTSNAKNYGLVLAGDIAGTGGLTIYGPGVNKSDSGVTINTDTTYTGDTHVVGSLVLGSTDVLPNGSRHGDVYVNGQLELNFATSNDPMVGEVINGLYGDGSIFTAHSGNTRFLIVGDNNANGDYSGSMSDFGLMGLTKIGTGTQILSGNLNYRGLTTITAGTLIINGTVNTSSKVTVYDGATLGGSGSMGDVTVNAGGILAPGNSPGTLHTGKLVLNDTSELNFQLDSLTGPNDLIDVAGDLTLDGILNIENLGGLQAGQYLLISYTGLLTDNVLDIGALPVGFFASDFSIDTTNPGSVYLNVVPEPATLALLVPGLLAAGIRRRRHA